MKKFGILFFAFVLMLTACNAKPPLPIVNEPSPSAQTLTPISWTWKAEPLGNGEYKLVFTAKVDPKWHTYSQFIGDGGPVPTSVAFDKTNKDVQLNGKPTETGTKMHSGHDVVFDMELKYFENDMVIEQKVKVLKDTKFKGTLEFMACDDKSCLPPVDKDFVFDLKAGGDTQKKN